LTSKEIPTHILNFVKTRTNDNFGVSIVKNKIKLSNSDVNEFSRETPLGIVQTNKVVQVYNERNTKHTFKVTDPTNANSVINLIVVDMDGDIIEYFIQYIFDPNNLPPLLSSGAIDMSRFTGRMTFCNMDGVIIGNFILTDGDLVDFDGEIDPCPVDEVVEEEEDDTNDTNDSSTGGGNDNSDPNNNNNTDNDSSNGSTGGNGEISDPDQDDPCGIVFTYNACCSGEEECDGNADGHSAGQCGCGNGSSIATMTDTCNGSTVIYNRTNARTVSGNSSPCDGDTGVIAEIDEIDDIVIKKHEISNCLDDQYDSSWYDETIDANINAIHEYLDGNCTDEAKSLVLEFEEIEEKIPDAIFERFRLLKQKTDEDPWVLLQDCAEQDGLDTSNYLELYNLPFPEDCSTRLFNLGVEFHHQPFSDGNVPIANIDYYPVEITQYPDFNEDGNPDSETEMFQAFRNKFIDLASGQVDDFEFGCNVPFNDDNTGTISWEFEPMTNQDGLDFVSNNPVTSILFIEADASGLFPHIATDDGAIIVSELTNNDFTISTIRSPNNGTQPFSGNRQWGWLINENGNFEFFTRAVDVANISDITLYALSLGTANDECQQDTYYNVGEATWKNMQEEIVQWVYDYDGQANILPSKAKRVDKELIEEILTSNESIDDIISDCY
jgi:hypothetical protein